MIRKTALFLLLSLALASPVQAGEAEAYATQNKIREFHTPFDIIFDVMFTTPDGNDLHGWTSKGDSALWTGVYLAADAYRYAVTRSDDARESARRTLSGIDKLSRISGDGLLARWIYPKDGAYIEWFHQEQKGNYYEGTLDGREYYYITRTTRDQYAGIIFGLGVAYDLIDDEGMRNQISEIVTRLVDNLLKNNWCMVLKDGTIHETFLHRPEMILSILQLGRTVNPGRFKKEYETARFWRANNVPFPLWIETRNHDSSYFKYNLDVLYLYTLMRFEEPGSKYLKYYRRALDILEESLRDHYNAHFNMIFTALAGPNDKRDQMSRDALEQLLAFPARQKEVVDVRGKYKECKPNRACNSIPVYDRGDDGFIWQRGPFTLYWTGDNRYQDPGLDYILPYWMGRYFGVISN